MLRNRAAQISGLHRISPVLLGEIALQQEVLWAAPAWAALGRRCGTASHRSAAKLPVVEEQWLFHGIHWSNSKPSHHFVKINRQPCPSLSMQQLFPNADRKVVPISPYGPHVAHRLIHVIRQHTSQTFFLEEQIFLYLLSLSNFLWYSPCGCSLPKLDPSQQLNLWGT